MNLKYKGLIVIHSESLSNHFADLLLFLKKKDIEKTTIKIKTDMVT